MPQRPIIESQKNEILRKLDAGRAALASALVGIGDELAVRKPPADRWSVLECVEHMVLSERYLLTRLEAATKIDQPRHKPEREATIAERANNRDVRIEAPEMVRPAAAFASLREALEAFDATRAKVIRWVEETEPDFRCLVTDHPLFHGPVTCYETLVMMAAHPARHAKQIVEIRQQLKI